MADQKRNKPEPEPEPIFQLRGFPVEIRELITRTASHLEIDRETLVGTLLRRDLAKVAELFAEIDRRNDEIKRWWKSIERKDVE